MRWPRPTVRRMMIVVAAAAVLLATSLALLRSIPRSDYCGYQAEVHRQMERPIATSVFDEAGRSLLTPEELAAMESEIYAYHHSLRLKYEEAAAMPWREIPPDPPHPIAVKLRRADMGGLSVNYGRQRPR